MSDVMAKPDIGRPADWKEGVMGVPHSGQFDPIVESVRS